MRRLLALVVLAGLTFGLDAESQTVSYVYQLPQFITTSPGPSTGGRIVGTGAQYHQLAWSDSGTVSTCTIAVDSSVDGITWTAGGVIAGTACTTSGNITSGVVSTNYVRINVTVLTGGGVVTALLTGYANNPAGGGGGGSGTSPTQPGFLVTASPYNAKCDSSTDDTTALQSAITAANAVQGTVILPSGTCKITSALVIPAGSGGVTITGQTYQTSYITQATSNADIIDANGTGVSPINGFFLRNLTLQRPGNFTGTPTGVSLNFCKGCGLYDLQIVDSYRNIYTVSGANNHWERVYPISNLATVNAGVYVDGNTNSLLADDLEIIAVSNGTVTGMQFNGVAIDTFLNRFQTTGGVATGVSVSGIGASDIHFINPIMDVCSTYCFNITNSTAGGLSAMNNVQIVDCWCNGSANGNVFINNSEGVQIIGGTYSGAASSANTMILISGASSVRNSVVGAHVINIGGTSVNFGINISTGAHDNIVANNIISAPAAHPFNNVLYLATAGGNNVISGNHIDGYGNYALVVDGANTGVNTLTGNIVDSTHMASGAVYDGIGGDVYTGNQLSNTVIGNAISYKSTAAISTPSPVKWDTGNVNQVVVTTTTDTGGGIPVGVCASNASGAGGACLVMTTGTIPLTLGTGTCAIGNFVIVDTTTNGRVKCTATYTAGTVIGVAQAAQAVVGNTLNVQLGLR